MGLLGWFEGTESNLVVVMYEGPDRLRLNGNRMKGRKGSGAKLNAAGNKYTVCWAEFSQGGARLDQGIGPAGTRLGPGEAERLLRELNLNVVCKEMLRELEQGQKRCARILSWKRSNQLGRPASTTS